MSDEQPVCVINKMNNKQDAISGRTTNENSTNNWK